MFRVSQVPTFTEGVNFGGEDVDWMNALKKSGLAHFNFPERLYYVRLTNRDRIGLLKLRHPAKRRESNKARRNA
jgi:hypothetical protein